MSKILKALEAATDLQQKRGEDMKDYQERLVLAVGDLGDAEWEKIPKEAQDWFNDAADALNDGKALPDFPDAEAEAKTPATTSRRGAAKAKEPEPEPAADVPEVGGMVVITTKRGKVVEGKLVEVDGDVAVVEVDGEEQEFQKDRVESIVKKLDEAGGDDPEGTEDQEPQVDDEVTVVTKRGQTVTGKVVEVDDEIIVLDVDGEEKEFQRGRLESITIAGESEPEKPAASSRRGAAKAKEPETGKNTKISSKANGGVSATVRMRELILDDMDASKEDIAKQLKKEKLEFRDNTLDLVYSDVHKLLKMMRERKLIK